jgi:hypothetical protein
METPTHAVRLLFDGPVRYQIRVQGRISEVWSDRLEGMLISSDAQLVGSPITTLVGELADQAAVVGVINTLYELHLPLMSVECLSSV